MEILKIDKSGFKHHLLNLINLFNLWTNFFICRMGRLKLTSWGVL